MQKQSDVVFRNVGQLYFPQSRVECHYSLTSQHHWTNNDWIGIFKVGWSSVKDYYTFAWALTPQSYTKGTNVNCCVHFRAFYLPRPGPAEYQFVYVDERGRVCGRSRQFTFCAPKPLDELETLPEERDGEEEEEGEEEGGGGMGDLLLVVPRAQLLQSRLDECLRERAALQQALDESEGERGRDRERSEEEQRESEREREEMTQEISELRENLRRSCERMEAMEGKQKDVQCSQETLSTELSGLLAVRAESKQQIRELEDDIMALTDKEKETETELERMKERVKKMSTQRKDEELERKNLQMEIQAVLEEQRGLQERLEASERGAEALRSQLSELGARHGHAHAELHQARLQAAQLTLQLSESNVALREGRANWAQEREAFKQAAEVDKDRIQKLGRELLRKEEWLQEERVEREKLEVELGSEKDCNRAQLSDARREAQELKAELRTSQREREQQQLDRQELMDYIHQLEQKLDVVADTRWSGAAWRVFSAPESSTEGDKPASPQPPRASPPQPEALVLSTRRESPSRAESHAHTASLHHCQDDNTTLDTHEDEEGQRLRQRPSEEKTLVLPDLADPVLSELADSPLW